MQTFSPIAIANFFISEGKKRQLGPFTHMQLQKLVYFAHGWHLAVTEHALVDEPFEAWEYGPVSPTLYHCLKSFRDKPILSQITQTSIGSDFKFTSRTPQLPFEFEKRGLIEDVLEGYGRLSAADLSRITHQRGGPWRIAAEEALEKYQRIPLNYDINDSLIRNHFVKLKDEQGKSPP